MESLEAEASLRVKADAARNAAAEKAAEADKAVTAAEERRLQRERDAAEASAKRAEAREREETAKRAKREEEARAAAAAEAKAQADAAARAAAEAEEQSQARDAKAAANAEAAADARAAAAAETAAVAEAAAAAKAAREAAEAAVREAEAKAKRMEDEAAAEAEAEDAKASKASVDVFAAAAETFGAPTPTPTPEPVKAMTPTPITGTKAAPKTRGERRAELVEATNRVKEELKTATDTKSVDERKARLLARLERNESLEVAVEVALIDKDPQLVTEVLQQTSNVVAASEALAALYRSDENRAAEVLMGLDAARGAEYLRLMVDQLNDADAASALVGAEEPGRVVAVAQFLLPYGARSVLYKGKELLALVAATSPEAAKTIYAGLEYTEQVSILRRLVLGLGQRPGSEDKEEGALSRTALVDAAAFGASKPDFDTAASLLSGMEAKKATEVLHRFRTRGVKSGSEKWQRRQDAVEEVQKVLSAKNASLAADVAGLLAKKKK